LGESRLREDGPHTSICAANNCEDFAGIGSPDMASSTVNTVMVAPMPRPTAAMINKVSATFARRQRMARLK
jgi:hypothetical protein